MAESLIERAVEALGVGIGSAVTLLEEVAAAIRETAGNQSKVNDLADKLAGEAVMPWAMTPEEFAQHIRSEITRWTALAKARNIQLDE